jgi:hypothetical protein
VGYFVAPKNLDFPTWDARYFELTKEIVETEKMLGASNYPDLVWRKLTRLYREMEDYLRWSEWRLTDGA